MMKLSKTEIPLPVLQAAFGVAREDNARSQLRTLRTALFERFSRDVMSMPDADVVAYVQYMRGVRDVLQLLLEDPQVLRNTMKQRGV